MASFASALFFVPRLLLLLASPLAATTPTTPKLEVSRIANATISYPTGDPSFSVMQPFPNGIPAEEASPFLMCDEWGEISPEKVLGVVAKDPGPPATQGGRHVGWHPHRGQDLISYIKEGRGSHADSLGNAAIVRPGGIQWMRAGSGVEHAEGGGNPPGAAKHGFQIWINLPASLKMARPDYGTVQPEAIPEIYGEQGGSVARFLAGGGGLPARRSASFNDRDDFVIIDVELPPGSSSYTLRLPARLSRVIAYAYQGRGTCGGKAVAPQQAAVMTTTSNKHKSQEEDSGEDHEDMVELELKELSDTATTTTTSSSSSGYAVLVFAGTPLQEPISWHGPIVMNTQEEVEHAFQELRNGGFLHHRAPYDYKEEGALATRLAQQTDARPRTEL